MDFLFVIFVFFVATNHLSLPSMKFILTNRNRINLPPDHCLLTFDDGPAGSVTDELLAVLREFKVRACFCLIGSLVLNQPQRVKSIADDGHVLVNHTYHHRFANLLSLDRLEKDLALCDAAVAEAIEGPKVPLLWFRPPFGLVTESVRVVAKTRRILPITHFAFDTLFRTDRAVSAERSIVQDAKRHRGGIFVLHDGLFQSHVSGAESSSNRTWIPRAVRRILEELSGCGFEFPEPEKILRDILI
jgi:peptidoglycan-N-acetylglucosamine deacetylase